MKEILTERPQKVVVSKGAKGWFVTITLDVTEVDGGFECDYFVVELDHRPVMDDVRTAIINHINAETDEKILSGYVWNGKPVWLSSENQFNFKAAYDVAVQTGGATLPVKFKLGEIDGQPVYHTFKSMNAFTEFYTGAIGYIQQTLTAGWVEKDAVDEWLSDVEL